MKIDREAILTAHISAERIESELRLPKGFVFSLLNESDWALVIKLYALIESTMTLSISRSLLDSHPDGLLPVIKRLDSGDSRRGKLAFAYLLSLIEDQDKKFIIKLSELRNNLAHGIENIGFTFQDFIALADSNQKVAFVSNFRSSNSADAQESHFGYPLDNQKILDNPKEYVFLGALDVLHIFECVTCPIEVKRALLAVSTTAKEALMRSLFTDPSDTEYG